MSPVLCQSATLPMRLNLACQNRASEVLYGVYLCASHGHAWRRRLKAGEKIRLHPQRIWSHQSLPDFTGLPVVPAGVRDIPAASGHSSEAPASVPLPPNEPGEYPPTYCFRSYCILCGRGTEYITRQRKPAQGATHCAHCNGRMIVEFETAA